MRPLLLAILALTLGCKSDRISAAARDLTLGEQRVQFPRTFVGHPTYAQLELRNGGKATRSALFSTSAPFSTEAGPLEVAGGASLFVRLGFSGETVGDWERPLQVQSEDAVLQATLAGTAEPVPDCAPRGPCRQSQFDPVAGTCVDTKTPDGAPCPSVCLPDAQCRDGECVGAAKDCDDRDACTTDACEPASGCIHFSATARCGASTDPCQVPICDPAQGCSFVEAADGTSCGPADCSTAEICLLGVCKHVQITDGAACGAPSPCQNRGLCLGQSCVRPAAHELTPAWTVWVPEGHHLSWDSIADPQGNVYWRESEPDYSSAHLVSVTKSGLLRYSVPIAPTSQMALVQDVLLLRWGARLEARRVGDGSLRWSRELQADADGGTISIQTLARGTSGTAYIGLIELNGESSQAVTGSALVALSLATGATTWEARFPLEQIAGPATPVDEAGYVYLGTTGTGDNAAKRRYYGLSPSGQVRWDLDNPHDHPAAVFGGRVYHWDHWLSETATGAWANTEPPTLTVAGFPRLALGAVSYAGNTIGAVPNCPPFGTLDAGTVMKLVRVDPATSRQRWILEIGGVAGGLAMTNTVLTSRSTILFSQAADYCGATNQDVLREVSSFGEPGFSCALPPEASYFGEGLLNDGQWIAAVAARDSGREGVRAFDLPGFELPLLGWATAWGSSARDNHAR